MSVTVQPIQDLLGISTEVFLFKVSYTAKPTLTYVGGYGLEWAWTTGEPLPPPHPETAEALRKHIRTLRRVLLIPRAWPPIAQWGDVDAVPEDTVDVDNPAIRGIFDLLCERNAWPEVTTAITALRAVRTPGSTS